MKRSTADAVQNSAGALKEKASFFFIGDFVALNRVLKKTEIAQASEAAADGMRIYKDSFGNRIEFYEDSMPAAIEIKFLGKNGRISLERDLSVAQRLRLECGTDAWIELGEASTFDKVTIYSAYAGVQIGRDCMLSYDVFIRNHDSHHIYDVNSGERMMRRPLRGITDMYRIGHEFKLTVS